MLQKLFQQFEEKNHCKPHFVSRVPLLHLFGVHWGSFHKTTIGDPVIEVAMANAMLRRVPERAKTLILTGAISGNSMFLLADDSGVTRPTYKDLTQGELDVENVF